MTTLNKYKNVKEIRLCTTCSSYVLVLPDCESRDGEWGACGLWKEIKQWDDRCYKWWDHTKGINDEESV